MSGYPSGGTVIDPPDNGITLLAPNITVAYLSVNGGINGIYGDAADVTGGLGDVTLTHVTAHGGTGDGVWLIGAGFCDDYRRLLHRQRHGRHLHRRRFTSISDVNFGTSGASNGTDLYVAAGTGTVTLGGNTFAATTNYINNQSANNIDATGDTFGSYNKSVLADDYAIEDKIVDGLDASGFGLVHIQAGTSTFPHSARTPTQALSGCEASLHWIRRATRSTPRRLIPSAA